MEEFIENLAWSSPPVIDQVTVSSAEKAWIAVVFSLIDLVLFASPADPEGPVIEGFISSISATVTVTVWSEVLLALSVALTETIYELFLSVSLGVS